MEETKMCPNCEKEILAVAKKCKYCGIWLEPKETMRCPICLELIPKDVDVCPMCHERIKLVEEKVEPERGPVQEVFSEVGPEIPRPSSAPTVPVQRGNKKKITLISSIAATVVIIIGVFLVSPWSSKTVDNADVVGGGDATELHDFFFHSLCEPIPTLTQNEVVSRRLRKLLKKSQLEFIENNLSVCSPVYLKTDDQNRSVFSFFGTKNATTNPETYTVNYIDAGGQYGWFEVITVIGGKRTQSIESVKPVESVKLVEPAIREWHYEGTIGNTSKTRDIGFTLYVDGSGEPICLVKGMCQKSGDVMPVPVVGNVRPYAGSVVLSLWQPGQDLDFVFVLYPQEFDEFKAEVYNRISLDLALCLDGSSDRTGEDVKLLRTNRIDLGNKRVVTYEGKLFNEKVSYPIGMELSIDSSDRENEVISGFYYYKNKGRENFIPLIGSCSHGYSSGSVATLFLETMSSSENFEVQDVGSLWGKGRITGIWTLYDGWNQETVKNELKLELKNKSL